MDDVGAYIDLEGEVVEVEEEAIRVKTEHGVFTGYFGLPNRLPSVGYRARIRVYDSGGGFYPDNRVMGWSRA